MKMKNTILSRKDIILLEDVIVSYGRIVSFAQLKKVFKKVYSLASAQNRILRLAKLGWLVRLKKGLYIVVTDIGALASGDISAYTICQALNKDSYISFESALQYHNMFDQMLASVGAVTVKQARRYKVKDNEFKFFRIKKNLYFGFLRERSDIGLVNIARGEKALLDILHFRSNAYYASLVWEKLNDFKQDIEFTLLKQYAKKFNLGVIRQIGFFLDRLDIDTEELAKITHGKTSYSRMTRESKQFNAKWRLYFDDRIIK